MESGNKNLPSYTLKDGQKGHSKTLPQRGLKGPRKRHVFQDDFLPVIFDNFQSNAIGRAEAERYLMLTKWPFDPSGIWTYYKTDRTATDNGSWQRLQVGSPQTTEPQWSGIFTHFGGYVTAAIQLSVILDRDVFMIPVAEGGTTLTPDTSVRDHYPETVNELFRENTQNYFRVAIDKLRAAYPGREIVVFEFLHGGETDAAFNTTQLEFYSALVKYHNSLNSFDPLFKRTPHIITKIRYMLTANEDKINEVYEKFAREYEDVYLVDISELPRKNELTVDELGGITGSSADDEHLSYLGQIEKGIRGAEFCRQWLGWPETDTDEILENTGFDASTIANQLVHLPMDFNRSNFGDYRRVTSFDEVVNANTWDTSGTNTLQLKMDKRKGFAEFDQQFVNTVRPPAAVGGTWFNASFSVFFWVKPRDGQFTATQRILWDANNLNQTTASSRVSILITAAGKILGLYESNNVAVQGFTNDVIFVDNTQAEPLAVAVVFDGASAMKIYTARKGQTPTLQAMDAGSPGTLTGVVNMTLYTNATLRSVIGALEQTSANNYSERYRGLLREFHIHKTVYTVADITNLMKL